MMDSGDFSLMRGGPTYRLVHGLGRHLPGVHMPAVLAILLVTASFVPLLVLCGRDGTLLHGGVAMPLLGDWFVMFRFLLALPLLALAAPGADARLRAAMCQLVRSGVVARRDHARAGAIMAAARRARDGFLPELACLALAILPTLVRTLAPEMVHGAHATLDSWQFDGGTTTSAAGHWAENVSGPLFRFVVLLWLWRFLLWAWLLWRFSRMHLELRPAHPDQSGGVAFLGQAQTRFAVLSTAGGFVVSGYCINQMQYAGESLFELRHVIGGYVVGSPLLLLAPLLVMAVPLARAKRHALSKYGLLGHRVAGDFDRMWRRGRDASMLDSPSPSALADYGGGAYANVAAMRMVPVTRRNVFGLIFAAAVAFLPMVFFAMSLDELAQRLFSILV